MSNKGVLKGLKLCTRASEPYESAWERDYMRTLDADPTIRRWERCRSLWIPYVDSEGQRRGYNPDFMVERVGGTKEIHEVKGGHLMESEGTRKKLEAAEKFCRKRGMVFKVITRNV